MAVQEGDHERRVLAVMHHKESRCVYIPYVHGLYYRMNEFVIFSVLNFYFYLVSVLHRSQEYFS